MTKAFKSIFLHGFRATGKSTIGKLLAKRLGFEHVEMDQEIEHRAGVSIAELTNQGTDWLAMRRLESQLLQELLTRSGLVVSTGGGLCVNTVIDPQSGQTFGQLNFDLVTRDQQNLHLVLTAYIDTLVQRLRQDELSHDNPLPKRPILNPTQAQKLQQLLCLFDKDPEIQKEILIKEIIEDSITVFLQRRPKYEQLSQHLIATDFLSPEELVEQIYQKINS